MLRPCSSGSKCKIYEETGEPYCVYSCACDNGGCTEGEQCTEVAVPTCDPGQCCSPVTITCTGKYIMVDYNVYMSAPVI